MTSPTQTLQRFSTFRIGPFWLGLPAADVLAYQLPQGSIALNLNTHVAGLMYYRGQMLTLLDLWGWLLPDQNLRPLQPLVLILCHQQQQLGLLSDEAGDILDLPTAGIEALPRTASPALQALASGFYPAQDGGLVLLESARLFPPLFPPAGASGSL
jgi:chemotaxis signal transduction protein